MLKNLYTNPYELSQINPFNMDCIHESGFAGSLFVDIKYERQAVERLQIIFDVQSS